MNDFQTKLQSALGGKWVVEPSDDGLETYVYNHEQTAASYAEGKFVKEAIFHIRNDESSLYPVDSVVRAINAVWDKHHSKINTIHA